MVKCPVCKVELSGDGKVLYTLSGAKPVESYTVFDNGETYRFCSRECLAAFESEPEKYIGGG